MTGPRLSLILWARAAREIEQASDWWRANRLGSPEALADELTGAFDLVSLQPGVGAPARSARLRNVRRLLLRRVGYFLYYRVVPERGEVQVLRFRHARRGTGPRL